MDENGLLLVMAPSHGWHQRCHPGRCGCEKYPDRDTPLGTRA